MHRYLHSYEDFLLIDEDYVVRSRSKLAGGPKSRPWHKRWVSDNDNDFDDDDEYADYSDDEDDEEDVEYDYDEDDDWR